MEFSVNYSEPLVRLLEQGQVTIDRFKLPAWPDVIEKASQIMPGYVHFPLTVGSGVGDAWDNEREALVNWESMESIMRKTQTPMFNLHLAPMFHQHSGISDDYSDPDALERIIEATLDDIDGVTRRWGKEMILAENISPQPRSIPASFTTEFIRTVIRESGVHFLLDISHARLAARMIGADEMEYLLNLPLERTSEIHITGIQRLEGSLAEKLLLNRPKEFDITAFIGKEIDHQSMTENDFAFLAGVYQLIAQGLMREPWIASMEYGGIGPFWELSLNEETLAEQLPRLYQMTHPTWEILP